MSGVGLLQMPYLRVVRYPIHYYVTSVWTSKRLVLISLFRHKNAAMHKFMYSAILRKGPRLSHFWYTPPGVVYTCRSVYTYRPADACRPSTWCRFGLARYVTHFSSPIRAIRTRRGKNIDVGLSLRICHLKCVYAYMRICA